MMEGDLRDFYLKNLDAHGASAMGVGWKNQEAQLVRFQQLVKLFAVSVFSVNDLGCGVGDLVAFTREKFPACTYRGYDVIEDMISAADKKYGRLGNVSFELIKQAGEMQPADYTVASGIFNIRFERENDSWLKYVLETLRVMDAKSALGFSFNLLTKYSDREFMKAELYYADPCFFFDFCKTNFSKNVALLHDYNQYDFTIIVRKTT